VQSKVIKWPLMTQRGIQRRTTADAHPRPYDSHAWEAPKRSLYRDKATALENSGYLLQKSNLLRESDTSCFHP
jgi:hypothetical protein